MRYEPGLSLSNHVFLIRLLVVDMSADMAVASNIHPGSYDLLWLSTQRVSGSRSS